MSKQGILKFEYRGEVKEIPYSSVPYGGKNRLHLIDKKRCVHIFDFNGDKWTPLRPEKYPHDFLKVLDWVIKQELGNK